MEDIITKLCCCAMFAVCCMDGAEGMHRNQITQNRVDRNVNIQTVAQNAINYINAAAVNIERLTQSLLNGNQQINDDIRGQLLDLRFNARNITEAYIVNLNTTLNNAGISVNIQQNIAQNAANGGVTVRGSLGSFRNYVNNIQVGVNNLNRIALGLPQGIRTTVNNNAMGMQQGIDLMNNDLASLQQLTAPTQAQPQAAQIQARPQSQNANDNNLLHAQRQAGVETDVLPRPLHGPSLREQFIEGFNNHYHSDDSFSDGEEESEAW